MDYKAKKYDETNQGRLFKNTDGWKVTHQGKINFDGEEHRIIGVARLNKDKQPITELYKAMGTLKEKEKTKEDSPDAGGVVNVIKDVDTRFISAWKKTTQGNYGQDENQYINLAVNSFDSKKVEENKTEENNEQDQETLEDIKSVLDID